MNRVVVAGMGVVAGIAVSLVTRRLLLRRFATAKLEELWKGATETMMMPSETVVLAPCASDEESRASFLPQGPPCELCFALTAFDPPGVERSREENARENEKMWKELRGLEPKARWVGYGCDLDEGWREDGFFLEFDPADAEAARARILEVARAFDQGAIYEYYAYRGAFRRRTIGAKLAMDAETPMCRVSFVEDHPLTRLPWAGPKDALFY